MCNVQHTFFNSYNFLKIYFTTDSSLLKLFGKLKGGIK